MPTCRTCQGTGRIEVKTEITRRCPDCDGTKMLPDDTACKRCNQWGEIGTGKFKSEEKLCTTCWGSGKVSEKSLTAWFLVRAVPSSLVVLGVGGALIWAVWTFVPIPAVLAITIMVVFGLWGNIMYHFTRQMPDIGEISATNWFLSRAIPTTITTIAVGGAGVWVLWVYLANATVTVIVGLAILLMWAVIMYYYISRLPE